MSSCLLHFFLLSNMALEFGYTAAWCLSVAVDVTQYHEYWECFFFFSWMECRTIWWNIHRCECGLTFCTIYQGGKQCKSLKETHGRAATSANRHRKKKTYSVFGVENVGSGWVVDNDDVVELSSQPAEVFHVVPSVKNAGFSEEPRTKHPPLVQQVRNGVCILSQTHTHTKIHNIKNRNMTHILHINSCANTTFKCLFVG